MRGNAPKDVLETSAQIQASLTISLKWNQTAAVFTNLENINYKVEVHMCIFGQIA